MSLLKRNNPATLQAQQYDGLIERLARFSRVEASVETEQDTQPDELARLHLLVADHEAERAAASEALDVACNAAFDRGVEQGRQEAENRELERLTALGAGIDAMLAELRARIEEASDTAVDIAQAALNRILADAGHYRELIVETARHHAATLLERTVVRVAVSTIDFPDDAALAELQACVNGIAIDADPALKPGTCRFKLSLGELDASIPAQATAVRQVLDQTRRSVR